MIDKKCMSCERPIKGRSDKKFCDDLCRNSYNNRLRNYSIPVVRNINNILRKNRRILEELLSGREKKVVVVERKKLIEKGFHFEYLTEQINLNQKKEYYFCYDYGYRSIDNDKVAVIKDTRKRRKSIQNNKSPIPQLLLTNRLINT